MDDEQLDRKLQSIGLWCFVTYFEEFCNDTVSDQDVAALIVDENPRLAATSALIRRVYPARNIIKAGRAEEALIICSKSKVPKHIQEKAAELAACGKGACHEQR